MSTLIASAAPATRILNKNSTFLQILNTLSRIMNTFGYVAKTNAIDKLCAYFGVPVGKIMEHIEDTEN
jgi:hypothetical protein